MAAARLLLTGLTTAAANSARRFSSSAVLIRRAWTHRTDDSGGESAVYKRALRLQRPTTVKHHEVLHNCVSLIGVIQYPLKLCNADRFGIYTLLEVSASTVARHNFCVMVKFWDEMARMSLQHLRVDDLVYVSGHLRSYAKVDEDGKPKTYYEVVVSELNFIAQNGLKPANQNRVKLEPKVSAEEIMQKRRDRLHLWQLFFANPYEWWDNRNHKLNPKAPDFKHKDTGEVLWIDDSDPAWIKRQLQLHDSRVYRRSPGEGRNAWSHLSPLTYDDV